MQLFLLLLLVLAEAESRRHQLTALSAPRVPAVRCLAIQGLPGGLRQDADAVGVLVGTAATYLGYAIFRDAFAQEFDLDLGELDALALQTLDQMLEGLAPDTTPSKGNRP